MLIDKYDLEVTTPPCEPGAERFSGVARLVTDIREALPYLNATLRGAVYNDSAPALTWKKGGHNVAFHPYQIAVSNVEDRDAAVKEVEGLVKLVNRTWERRDEIEPDHEMHRRPGPLDIYKLLPQTNCKACGQPTCYTFALKLAVGQVTLSDCPVIQEPEYAGQWAQLRGMVAEDLPAIGPRN
jgi:ArsR family metal-binding transcriptional regulator